LSRTLLLPPARARLFGFCFLKKRELPGGVGTHGARAGGVMRKEGGGLQRSPGPFWGGGRSGAGEESALQEPLSLPSRKTSHSSKRTQLQSAQSRTRHYSHDALAPHAVTHRNARENKAIATNSFDARRSPIAAAEMASAADDAYNPQPPPPYDVLSLAGQTALITGASAGFGEAIAWRLAAAGVARLILVARRKHRLDALAAAIEKHHPTARVAAVAADLSDPRQAETLIPDMIPAEFLADGLDILINNAGLALGVATVADNDLRDARTMLETNVFSVVALTKSAVRLMLSAAAPAERPAQKPGHVVFLSSVAGHEAYGGGSVYCATKHALEAFATATRHDLVATPIRVTSVAPGAVWTEFSEVRFRGDKAKADAVYGGFEALRAADIADEVVYCLTRPARVQITDVRVLAASQCSAKGIHRRDPQE